MSAPRYKWQPTTADIAKAAGIPVEDVIRFDHNTSPFATDWVAGLVVDPACHLNEYPGADYRPIREAAARYSGTTPDQVTVGAGVDELLLLVGRAFLRPGAVSVMVTPTYPLYRISSFQTGATVVELPAGGPDLAFPIAEITAAARNADVTWLCVPDNPTGARIDDGAVAAVIDAAASGNDGIVVIDAAYAEFSGDDWSSWIDRYPKVIALHTLSKGFGLAGIRVGFALGHRDLVGAIDAVRPPGSIGNLSVELAVAALDNPERMRLAVVAVAEARHRLGEELTRIGLRVLPSAANFLLCEVGPEARTLGERLMDQGLVVRMYPEDGPLGTFLRFTVRSPDENARLVTAIERLGIQRLGIQRPGIERSLP